jgi:predicted O-methyltransferase YrrM
LDDAAHFSLILETQTAAGMQGDLLEIGCYHGRSTALLAMCLRTGEQIVVCDAFDLLLRHSYGDPPTPDILWRNLQTAVPQLRQERVEIYRAYSRDLELSEKARFRFAHIDGGHERDEVLHDLRLCASHMLPGGIIALDDYSHPDYLGVTEGAQLFLDERNDFDVLADLNRRGALGRKLYLRFTLT